jgi:hypothetical protein
MLAHFSRPSMNGTDYMLVDDVEAELGENLPEGEMVSLEEGLVAMRLFFGSTRDLKPQPAEQNSQLLGEQAPGDASPAAVCQDDATLPVPSEARVAEQHTSCMVDPAANQEHNEAHINNASEKCTDLETESGLKQKDSESTQVGSTGSAAVASDSVTLCDLVELHPASSATESSFFFPCVVEVQSHATVHAIHAQHACNHTQQTLGTFQSDHNWSGGSTETYCAQQALVGDDDAQDELDAMMKHDKTPVSRLSSELCSSACGLSGEKKAECNVTQDSRDMDASQAHMAGIQSQIDALVNRYSQLEAKMRVLEQTSSSASAGHRRT